jgi:hypothetical protein
MSMLAPPKVFFPIVPDEASSATYRVVPLVDGIPLIELVEKFETARSFHPAGGYGGLALNFALGTYLKSPIAVQ